MEILTIERLIAFLIFVFILPLIAIILLINLFFTSSVIYKSKRIAGKSKIITLYKFRTIHTSYSESKINQLYLKKNEYLHIPEDSHIFTNFGKFLERYDLVELLQLINIIKGELSFFGNRPLPFFFEDLINENHIMLVADFKKRFDSPAGLIGVPQIIDKNYPLTIKQRIHLEALHSRIFNLNQNIYLKYMCSIFLLLIKSRFYKLNLKYKDGLFFMKKYL